jgi:Uma2 family endonuclease
MPPLPDLAFESTQTLSQSEFAAWVRARPASDDNRYELLGGRVVMTPPAGHPHGLIEGRLAVPLGQFIQEHRLGVYLGSSQGFELPSGDTVEPDHSFVSTARWQTMPAPRVGQFLRVVPDLVVEILSASTAPRDRGTKHEIYERNGVREYWLVDARARAVTVFALSGACFDGGEIYGEGSVLRSQVLVGLTIEVRSILPPEADAIAKSHI